MADPMSWRDYARARSILASGPWNACERLVESIARGIAAARAEDLREARERWAEFAERTGEKDGDPDVWAMCSFIAEEIMKNEDP